MADDVEMTLIPRDTESATGSAAAEPPKQDTTNIFGRFKKKLLFAEETVVFFKHLSILGLVAGSSARRSAHTFNMSLGVRSRTLRATRRISPQQRRCSATWPARFRWP